MIELLPPHIANQIAAGEVVQRGSSIVKELLENAVDAGASKIIVKIEDGGRTLISVIDNGSGMAPEEAPKAFLRHATSKIRTAEDLFNLHTFGFRGEALASIASVAEVEMRTRRECDELGTTLIIRDMTEVRSEPCVTPIGTSITVRNLFYSIPARRKFLKTDRYEAQLALSEFTRVALVNPSIEFEYHSNIASAPIVLRSHNLHERVVALTKPSYAKKLLPIEVDSPLVQITGYVGTPDTARAKSGAEQYFFVNGRYMRSAYLSRAVASAYDRLLSGGSVPTFFIYMRVPEARIDVNINPTKTEIKFEDEQSLWQLISSCVRSTLGKHNIVAAIDFEPSAVDIPAYTPSRSFNLTPPKAASDRAYNPFSESELSWSTPEGFDAEKAPFTENFSLPVSAVKVEQTVMSNLVDVEAHYEGFTFASGKYIVTSTVDGLAVVNTARARQRIEYERMLSQLNSGQVHSSRLTFAHTVELNVEQKMAILNDIESIEAVGFAISDGGGTLVNVEAIPDGFSITDFTEIVENREISIPQRTAELATRHILNERAETIINVGAFIEQLMMCEEPSYTPSGLPIIEIIGIDELDKRLKR